MISFNSATAYVVKKLWLLMAVLLVLFALLLSAMRYALPHLEHKKHWIEDVVNEQYGVNLDIGSVHAVWLRSGPSIVLNEVSLDKNLASPVSLNIEQVYVEIDFWQSLSQRLISSKRFDLNGVEVDVDLDRISTGQDEFPVVDALKNLFLNQLQSFSLQDGVVVLSSGDMKNTHDIEALSWQNRGTRHQGTGLVRLRGVSTNSASFIVDLVEQGEQLEGVVYAKAQDLDFSPWVGDLVKTERPLTKSQANFEVWATIQHGVISGVTGQFDDSLIEWGNAQQNTVFTAIRGGNLQLIPHNDGWNIRVDQLILDSNNETLVTDVVGQWYENGTFVLNTVKPVQVNPFLMLLPIVLDDSAQQEFHHLNPQGEVATLQLQVNDSGVALAAKVIDLSWSKTDHIPGLSSLDADVYWHQNYGAIHFNSRQSVLSAEGIIKQDVNVSSLGAKAFAYTKLEAGENHWHLALEDVVLSSDLLSFDASANFNFGTGELSTVLDIAPMALNNVSQLFPTRFMGKNTNKYLTRAFTGEGQVERATVLWHGDVKAYPFNDNQGIFQAFIDIKDGDFLFSSKWPTLTNLNLGLRFVNRDLFMHSPTANLMDMHLENVQAKIPGLSPDSTLTITAKGEGTGSELTALMMNSSISNTLGNVLKDQVQVQGDLTADIQLDIPLHSRNGKPRATGTATLANNPVFINATKMQFSDVSGDIHFDNGDITATTLSASLLEQPVLLSFKGQQSAQYDLSLTMNGNWNVNPLGDYVNQEFARYVDGNAQWQLDLDLVLSKLNYHYDTTLTADLTQTLSNLPAPFNTELGDNLPLTITSSGDNQVSSIEAILGNNVTFTGQLPHKELQFSRALLSVGDLDIANRGTGFSVAAALDNADVKQWFRTIDALINGHRALVPSDATANQTKSVSLFPIPSRIFVEADTLTFNDITLNKVDLVAQHKQGDWLLDIDSVNARGEVTVNRDLFTQGVKIDLDYLNISKPNIESSEGVVSAVNVGAELNPTVFPPLYLHCLQCELFDIELGEVTLDLAKAGDGMAIRQLHTLSDDAELNAQGAWIFESGNSTTALRGVLTSSDVGQMLKQFDVVSGIKDSKATMNFDVHWNDSPVALSMEQLNGELDWSLTDGYLTELSDKGSRIFTVFSLNSLVRKMSLDFRDVFAKGFFYDKMSGTIQVTDGTAYTNDTVIDGGAGEIDIVGYSALDKQELDYNVSFTPNVTGNIPFLAYFLATPPTALAALAIDQMLTSAKVISNVNYRVSGTFSDPVIEEVARDSQDIALPAKVGPNEENDRPLTEADLQPITMDIKDG